MHPRSHSTKRRSSGDARLSRRPGVAILAFVVALLVIGTFALWLFQLTASTVTSALTHYYSTGIFYAAESGLELSLRELAQAGDIDSDGTIGTISDNGNDADDPALAGGSVWVTDAGASPPLYQATGRSVQTAAPWSGYRRVLEVRVE